MPYVNKKGSFEKARSIGHVPIAQSPFVAEKLRGYRVHAPAPIDGLDGSLVFLASGLKERVRDSKWVMSFDGSPQEVAVREEFPSTRVGYVQIASVLINLGEMLDQEKAQFVDPSAIRNSATESLISTVLPGSNVCRADMDSVKDSWRAEVYDIFTEYKIEETPLLDTYMMLVAHSEKSGPSETVRLARCSASDDCLERDIAVPRAGVVCKRCGGKLYPTDALRVHEEVLEEHSNVTALGRLMGVLEKLALVSYINFLFMRQPRVLGEVAFVIDGPLAVFGPQAWLHAPINAFLQKLRGDLVAKGFQEPLVVGVEKAGQFAEHAASISKHLPAGSVMALPDDYIYSHILTFKPKSNTAFGHDTYYGQKFFYKSSKQQMLTISIPKNGTRPSMPHDPLQYPTLPSVLGLLDKIGTSLYKDALIPVALAHSFASIPLRTGSKVLTLLSKELLGQGNQ